MSSNYSRNLYSKNVLVRMVNSKPSDDRFRLIHITVDYQMTTIPAHKNELIIKLTDENDPFFLYSLYLNEDDYQSLKTSQGLLVDFNSFGERLIGLLQECEKDERAENPKFQLCFKSKEPLNAMLEVIENNPFKLLCHVSLSFSPGNDNDVKKYLANGWVKLREEHSKLNTLYEQTKNELTAKLDNVQKSLAQKINEMERLKSEFEANAQRLTSKHAQELEFERERARQAEFATQQRYEKERKEAEANLGKTMKNMELRLQELEQQNGELSEKRYKNEQALQEKTYQIKSLQDDLANVKSELAQFKKENTTLDMKVHSSEKHINQLDLQIGQLQRDLKDKQEQIARFQDNLVNEQAQRKQLEDVLKEKQVEIKRKTAELTFYQEEFKKGSDSLSKLQESEKKLINQVKLKSKIVTEQEKKVVEKEKEVAQLSDEVKTMKSQIQSLNEEMSSLKSELKKKTNDLDDAMSKISQKESLINYYNKQLTEKNLLGGDPNKSYDPTASNSSPHMAASSFRPYGNLLSTNNHFINANLSPATTTAAAVTSNAYHQQMAKSTSGSALTNMIGFSGGELDITAPNGPNVNAAARFGQAINMPTSVGVSNVPKNPLLSSSSSSMSQQHADHSKENLEINPIILSARAENLKLGSNSSSSTTGATSTTTMAANKLDPKYFHNAQMLNAPMGVGFDLQKKQQQQQQQQQHHQVNNQLPQQLLNPMSKTNNLMSGVPLMSTNMAATNGVPLAKSSKPTPPLASAYFPN